MIAESRNMIFFVCSAQNTDCDEVVQTRVHVEHLFVRAKSKPVSIKIKLTSFKSSEHINQKGDGSYRGFGYLIFVSDPSVWQHKAKENNYNSITFNRVVKIRLVFFK